jgi:hypothetical protein
MNLLRLSSGDELWGISRFVLALPGSDELPISSRGKLLEEVRNSSASIRHCAYAGESVLDLTCVVPPE